LAVTKEASLATVEAEWQLSTSVERFGKELSAGADDLDAYGGAFGITLGP
jgi:hypothetical protein